MMFASETTCCLHRATKKQYGADLLIPFFKEQPFVVGGTLGNVGPFSQQQHHHQQQQQQ
jgi:hypothetical protein